MPTFMKQKDQETIRKILAQDEVAFRDFVKEHETGLYNYINRKLDNREKAEEMVQDVFIDFIEALRSFQGNSSLKTYLYSIAKYKVIDEIRKKKIKRVLFSALPNHFIESLAPVDFESEIERNETIRVIKRVFSQLPHDYAQILRLKYIEGEKVQDIAGKLSLPFKATESMLFRARKAFARMFTRLQYEKTE